MTNARGLSLVQMEQSGAASRPMAKMCVAHLHTVSTVHLVGLARHESGYVLQQVKVKDKSNEITAVPLLLQGRSLARNRHNHGCSADPDSPLRNRFWLKVVTI